MNMAIASVLVPLTGVRRRIRRAKQQELERQDYILAKAKKEAAIRVLQRSHFSEQNPFVAIAPEPPVLLYTPLLKESATVALPTLPYAFVIAGG